MLKTTMAEALEVAAAAGVDVDEAGAAIVPAGMIVKTVNTSKLSRSASNARDLVGLCSFAISRRVYL